MLLIFFAVSSVWGLVEDEFVLEAYDWSNYDGTLTLYYQTYWGFSQYMIVDQTGYLANATFSMYRVGSPQGYINCSLQGVAPYYPNGTVYALSDTEIYAYDLDTSPQNVTFNFPDIDYLMTAGETYTICVQWVNLTNVDASNYVRIGRDDNGGAGQEGYHGALDNSPYAWGAGNSDIDMIFELTGFEDEGGPEEETPTSTGIELDGAIEDFVAVAVPVGIIMLPLGLWIWLGKREPSKWIVLILLTIGIGLGVLYAGLPTWLIVLLAVGLVGLAYSDIKGG